MHLSNPSRRAIILIREQHTGRSFYVFLEIVIFLVEWAFYRDRLPETNPSHPGKDRVLLYAFLANALSFGAGVLLNMLWPIAF